MNNRSRNNNNNTNNSNNSKNWRQLSSYEKRPTNWNQHKDSKNGNYGSIHKNFKNYSNKNTNDSNNYSKNESNYENQSSQMPGICLKRNQSSPPFVTNESKLDTNNDGSGDNTSEQQLDPIAKQLSEIELTPNEKKEVVEPKESTTEEANTQSEFVGNKEWVFNRRRNLFNSNNNINTGSNVNPNYRHNSTGSVDYRYKRFNRSANDSNAFNNSHKFYRNSDRFNTNYNKYESNDQNKRPFKPKTMNLSMPPMNSVNPNPMPSYMCNIADPCNPFVNYMIQNPYTLPLFPIPPPIPPIGNDMNSESKSTNGKQIDGNKSDNNLDKLSNTSNDTQYPNTPYFIPYEPSYMYPNPPHYYGFINTISTENGFVYYFVSVLPPNISPLLLDVSVSGVPILPSNCYIASIGNTFFP